MRIQRHSAQTAFSCYFIRHHSVSTAFTIGHDPHSRAASYGTSRIQVHSQPFSINTFTLNHIQGPVTVRLQHSPHSLNTSYNRNIIRSHSVAFKTMGIHFISHSLRIRRRSHTQVSLSIQARQHTRSYASNSSWTKNATETARPTTKKTWSNWWRSWSRRSPLPIAPTLLLAVPTSSPLVIRRTSLSLKMRTWMRT